MERLRRNKMQLFGLSYLLFSILTLVYWLLCQRKTLHEPEWFKLLSWLLCMVLVRGQGDFSDVIEFWGLHKMQKKGFIVNKIHLISLFDIKGEFSPIHMKLVGNVKSPLRRIEALPTSSGTDAAEHKRLQVAEHPAHIQHIIQIVSNDDHHTDDVWRNVGLQWEGESLQKAPVFVTALCRSLGLATCFLCTWALLPLSTVSK